jgi:hypothetical protein
MRCCARSRRAHLIPFPRHLYLLADGRAVSAPSSMEVDRVMGRGLRYGIILALGLALPLRGQSVRGTITEEGSGVPLEGAVLTLVAADADSAYARVLSDASGAFYLSASPGRWRMRTELIGHRTVYSDTFVLSDQDVVLELSAPIEAFSIEGFDVSAAERRCVVRPTEEGLLTARAWEQARKALESSYLGGEAEFTRFEGILYERDLEPGSLRVQEERSESYRALGPKPFRSAPPEALALQGFVQVADSGTFYYAPDERVLLSDVFLDGHCFRLNDPEDSNDLLGLRFEPMGDSEVTDIEGVLWLDRATGELRSLDFSYVNLQLGVSTDHLGGSVRFQRLPTGVWIPRRWWIRMPTIEIQHRRILGRMQQRVVLAGLREQGGEVLTVVSGGARLEQLDRPRVQGVVFDSTLGGPLAGADVLLVGTGYATRTDQYGRYVLVASEGVFQLTFRHPRIESLHFVPQPVQVAMRSEVVRQIRLAVPSRETLLAQSCEPAEGPVFAGIVRDELSRPISGARVTMGWPASDRPREWRTELSDSLGRFIFCEAPAGADVLARAAHQGLTSETLTLRMQTRGVVHTELVVDTLRTASLAGIVSDVATGQPLAQVSVRLLDSGQEALTNARGEFALGDVPPGRQVLEFDHFLYGRQNESLELDPGSVLSISVSLAAGAIELDPLVVTVESRPLPGGRGFAARLESGIGFFLTEEQITRLQPIRITDLFNAVPGLTVACGDPSVLGSGCRVQFERARALDVSGHERVCPVQYFLDGSSVSAEFAETLRPQDIRGIEVYNGLSEVPPEFRRGPDTRCGVIAVWLKARR